jgi:hypothetical protein
LSQPAWTRVYVTHSARRCLWHVSFLLTAFFPSGKVLVVFLVTASRAQIYNITYFSDLTCTTVSQVVGVVPVGVCQNLPTPPFTAGQSFQLQAMVPGVTQTLTYWQNAACVNPSLGPVNFQLGVCQQAAPGGGTASTLVTGTQTLAFTTLPSTTAAVGDTYGEQVVCSCND